MADLNYLVGFGVIGVGVFLTVLFVPNESRPGNTRWRRLGLGLVFLVWFALTPALYWRVLPGLPEWALVTFLVGTGFGLSGALLEMRAKQRVIS